MRAFRCKDCQREVEHLEARLAELRRQKAGQREITHLQRELEERRANAVYNENWAARLVDRGGSRSDRCKDHRLQHKNDIRGIAVAYIDLQTVGEVSDRENPTGPLGGLGPLPSAHAMVPNTGYDLQDVPVGMTDAHVTAMIELLRQKQILILKAGTGTGKSTFAPYRLMDPPVETTREVAHTSAFAKLTDLGPIIVTEPRVQAAVGVATFVGEVMSGAGGVGPGFPVGYQVSGDRNHDEACDLIYVTDGTMINWLREGRLSRIGTVIVDEAHERNTNIDFIMGYLKRELPRYPHLRIIITSATFNTDFYLEYFGGPDVANVMEVPAEKSFGYGMPLFPNLDTPEEGEDDVLTRWADCALPLSNQQPRSILDFIHTHWKAQYADPLKYPDDVADKADDEYVEDVWDTTQRLLSYRHDGKIPMEQWQERMPGEMAKFVIQLANGLDEQGIFGDILGFLPTRRTIEPVCDEIERALGRAYKGQVFPLISTLPKSRQKLALAKRRMGEPRRIVISTNLAETSLTVEGVRFVVDSGVIAQSEWDPALAKGGIPTKPHSQAGIKQRWGRVGRKSPGWVFPLYTKGQYLALAEDTPPGSTRENLEALVMTAKMGGIDDVLGFEWPAAFDPTTVELDESARHGRDVFTRELGRADLALRAGGAIDGAGHPTSFGKELTHFQGLGSTASALAILYADRLACVPEVATIVALLENTRLIDPRGLLLDDYNWPDEWRLEAAERHRGLASLCTDEAELVLVLAAAWERADQGRLPWEDSPERQRWARTWWVNHSRLLEAAQKRHDVLTSLSPAMKENVKRFLDPSLIGRARGALTRALAAQVFKRVGDGAFEPAHSASPPVGVAEPSDPVDADGAKPTAQNAIFHPEDDSLIVPAADAIIALRRREARNDNRISSFVIAQPWALSAEGAQKRSSTADAMHLLVAASKNSKPDPVATIALQYLESWPVGQRVRTELVTTASGEPVLREVLETQPPFPRPLSAEEREVSIRGRGGKRGRRVRRDVPIDEEYLEGTAEDGSGELRLTERHGLDEEAAQRSEELEADLAVDTADSCGMCFTCLDGRPEDCDQPAVPAGRGEPEDPLATWFGAARTGEDVSAPRVDLDAEKIESGGWYEVAGYARVGDGYVVQLRPDWRRGQRSNAAQHPDLKAGDTIEVTVGRKLQHHGGNLRAFDRADGRGRFVLAEASSRHPNAQEQRREIAVSLDRGNSTLLSGLVEGQVVTATVVPARAKGTLTITLLELLHQHLSKAQVGRGAESRALDKMRRNATKVYTAVVEQPPNMNGYATARLLAQDSVLGLVHRFDFGVQPKSREDSRPNDEATATDETGPVVLTPGTPVVLHLVSDRAQLDVSGLEIERLLSMERAHSRQLEVSGLSPEMRSTGHQAPRPMPEQRASNNESAEDDVPEVVDPAPRGTYVAATTEKPLPRSAARMLAKLSDDPAWKNEVWAFWARTHHLRVDRQGLLPGTTTDPVDIRAAVTVIHLTPEEQHRKVLAEFATKHPPFSVVDCMVTALRKDGAVVDLGGGLSGFIPLAELSWANPDRGVWHSEQVIDTGESVRVLVMEIPDPPADPQLSIRRLTPDPWLAFMHSHPVGSRVSARVKRVLPTIAFVDLGNDVEGIVRISEASHDFLDAIGDALIEEESINAAVMSFDDARRQVELSIKELLPPPYDEYKGSHRGGETVLATVSRIGPAHLYVRLSGGASGAIHIGQVSYDKVEDLARLFTVGQEISAQILKFNDERNQVELSLKALLPNPYNGYKTVNRVGEVVPATVSRIAPAHLHVRLSGGASGAIHIGQVSYDKVEDLARLFTVGQEISAQILKYNDERNQVELSLKALLPNPYNSYRRKHQVGESVYAAVINTIPAMAFVDLGGGVQGTIHVSQLAAAYVSHPDQVVTKGQRVSPVIIAFDDAKERVQLSLKAAATPPSPPYTPPKSPVRRTVVAEGANVDEAIAIACSELGVSRYNATIDIIDQGQPKRFLRPARLARVKVTSL